MKRRTTMLGLALPGILVGSLAAQQAEAGQGRRRAAKPAAAAPAPGKAGAAAPAKPDANAAVMSQIEKAGGRAMQIAQNDDRLDVSFHLLGNAVTDTTLAPLPALAKKLIHLDLGQTAVTDAGLGRIKGLTGLVRLHLEGTKITDAGLMHLKGMTGLEYLNVYGTAVTDAGLAHLSGLKNLKRLYVWQTKVTDAGIEQLKKTLPQVEVIKGFDPPAAPAAAPAAPAK